MKKVDKDQKIVDGRPSKYSAKHADIAFRFCLLGATDKDLATLFETSEQTINNWKASYPDFFESIKKGKMVADANVAGSLYKRATGYEYTEVTNEEDDQGKTRKKTVRKHIPPDTTAAIFWLKNRQSDKWRDKQEIKHSGSIEVHNLTGYSDEELARKLAELESKDTNGAQ